MNETPELSVLIPVRDAGTTLASALRSVARQRAARFECLILDDGSRDDSPEIASQQCQRDGRFRLIRLPAKGIVAALNTGIELARAPYLARMDADDWMHRDRLTVQHGLLESRADWAAVGCHVRVFPRDDLSDGMRGYESWLNGMRAPADIRADAYVECPVAHPSLVVRREVAEALRYRDLPWPEDYDFVLRLLASGLEIGVAERRLLGWRHSQERLSRRDPRYSLEAFTACKAEALASGFLRERDRYTLWGHGPTGRSLARALASRGKRVARIVEVHPRRIGRTIAGAPVIAPDALSAAERSPIVASVAGREAREKIRGHLDGLGYREGADYVCAA